MELLLPDSPFRDGLQVRYCFTVQISEADIIDWCKKSGSAYVLSVIVFGSNF